MNIAALVMFKFLFCDSRIADPLIDRGIGVLPFEAEAKIVADAVGKQKVVPIPAQQFQGAEIKFALCSAFLPSGVDSGFLTERFSGVCLSQSGG